MYFHDLISFSPWPFYLKCTTKTNPSFFQYEMSKSSVRCAHEIYADTTIEKSAYHALFVNAHIPSADYGLFLICPTQA